MTAASAAPTVAARASQLRADFDRTFAEPLRLDQVARELLLEIRVGGEPFAVRLSEINGLYVDKKITPVPGSHAALRGIAGFRGTIVPVYDLRLLLGYPGVQAPRWLVIAAAAPVALAFDAFERQLRAQREAIVPQSAGSPAHGFAKEFVRSRKFAGPLIHLAAVIDSIST